MACFSPSIEQQVIVKLMINVGVVYGILHKNVCETDASIRDTFLKQ